MSDSWDGLIAWRPSPSCKDASQLRPDAPAAASACADVRTTGSITERTHTASAPARAARITINPPRAMRSGSRDRGLLAG